ncbi:hypothetical protein [Bacillus atrophaeus]|nr:hypothetical protein [Bacillus atrophaeus]
MTVEQAAEYLKVHPDYIPVLVAKSDDLKLIGDETSLPSVIRQMLGSLA